MIPRLIAEETLDASISVSLAMNSGREIDRVRRDLSRIASGDQVKRAARPTPATLAAMGVAVQIVPKR